MPLKSSSPSFREGATFATIGAFVVDLWNNQSISEWFFGQNGIYFFLGLVWGFFGSAFGLGSDFGFGSSTGLDFDEAFGLYDVVRLGMLSLPFNAFNTMPVHSLRIFRFAV